jgi:hypothetical protein
MEASGQRYEATAELRTEEFRARIHRHTIARLAAELHMHEDEAKKAYESELVNLGGARIQDFLPILATKRVRSKLGRRIAA